MTIENIKKKNNFKNKPQSMIGLRTVLDCIDSSIGRFDDLIQY